VSTSRVDTIIAEGTCCVKPFRVPNLSVSSFLLESPYVSSVVDASVYWKRRIYPGPGKGVSGRRQ